MFKLKLCDIRINVTLYSHHKYFNQKNKKKVISFENIEALFSKYSNTRYLINRLYKNKNPQEGF